MALYEIPLTAEPQSFDITLAGQELKLFVRWLQSPAPDAPGGWYLDIYKTPDDLVPVVMGIPLVSGCDLLAPYGYLELGGALCVSGEVPPDIDNLGSENLLLFETVESDDESGGQ